MWNTFNLGVGYCLVVPSEAVATALAICSAAGHQAWLLGEVRDGEASGEPLGGLPY
jgi:phosphoribosylformylglycinamidine cyclo-ligase